VLLHTELGPGHALFEGETLGGIIDWAETMVGDAEYDLAAVAFFIARGDGALLGAFLDGYGWSGPLGETLARRLLRYLLLHRYAPLPWLLEQRPVPAARSFDDLAKPWMGLA
jgi:hygromycin-B 7''-O-kinase